MISDIFGASGRDMLAALIAGQRHPYALAGLARKKMRAKMGVLRQAPDPSLVGLYELPRRSA